MKLFAWKWRKYSKNVITTEFTAITKDILSASRILSYNTGKLAGILCDWTKNVWCAHLNAAQLSLSLSLGLSLGDAYISTRSIYAIRIFMHGKSLSLPRSVSLFRFQRFISWYSMIFIGFVLAALKIDETPPSANYHTHSIRPLKTHNDTNIYICQRRAKVACMKVAWILIAFAEIQVKFRGARLLSYKSKLVKMFIYISLHTLTWDLFVFSTEISQAFRRSIRTACKLYFSK